MGDTPFHTFIELVALDQNINKVIKDIASYDAQLKVLAHQRTQLDLELASAKQRVHDMQKNVDLHELEMKELDAQEQAKKRQLDSISSPKEYHLIKTEIDFLKKKQHSLEDTLIAVWNDLENAKKDYAAKYDDHAKKMAIISAEVVTIEEKKGTCQAEYDKQVAHRDPIQATVPDEWIQKYAAMRTRVVDPVVPVLNGVCSACYYPVSEQDVIALNHRRLVQCKDCFRLLYLPAAQEQKS